MPTISTPIPGPLLEVRFIRRPNRFLLQVRLEDTGDVVEAHMADPGRLEELLFPEKKLWLRPASNPERKTRWTAVLFESPDGRELVVEAKRTGVRVLGRRCRVFPDRVE